VFTGDIQSIYSDEAQENFMLWFATAHELGHERFGFMDAQSFPQYHQLGMGNYNENTYTWDSYCIMDYNSTGYWQNNVVNIFCNKYYPNINFNKDATYKDCRENALRNLNTQ